MLQLNNGNRARVRRTVQHAKQVRPHHISSRRNAMVNTEVGRTLFPSLQRPARGRKNGRIAKGVAAKVSLSTGRPSIDGPPGPEMRAQLARWSAHPIMPDDAMDADKAPLFRALAGDGSFLRVRPGDHSSGTLLEDCKTASASLSLSAQHHRQNFARSSRQMTANRTRGHAIGPGARRGGRSASTRATAADASLSRACNDRWL